MNPYCSKQVDHPITRTCPRGMKTVATFPANMCWTSETVVAWSVRWSRVVGSGLAVGAVSLGGQKVEHTFCLLVLSWAGWQVIHLSWVGTSGFCPLKVGR